MHARGLRDHVESIWSHETDLVPSDPHHGSLHFRWADKDRKSTRLNSSHSQISYAVFCLKKKNTALVLAVALSRKFRIDRDIASQLPKISIISTSLGGIPVAFGIRDPLTASQIYWAEQRI